MFVENRYKLKLEKFRGEIPLTLPENSPNNVGFLWLTIIGWLSFNLELDLFISKKNKLFTKFEENQSTIETAIVWTHPYPKIGNLNNQNVLWGL